MTINYLHIDMYILVYVLATPTWSLMICDSTQLTDFNGIKTICFYFLHSAWCIITIGIHWLYEYFIQCLTFILLYENYLSSIKLSISLPYCCPPRGYPSLTSRLISILTFDIYSHSCLETVSRNSFVFFNLNSLPPFHSFLFHYLCLPPS